MTARQLTAAREAPGLSRAELADRLHVDKSAVLRWENGDREVPPFPELAIEHLSCPPKKTK